MSHVIKQFNWSATYPESGAQMNHKKNPDKLRFFSQFNLKSSGAFLRAKKQGIFDDGLIHIDITIILEHLKCLRWYHGSPGSTAGTWSGVGCFDRNQR